MTKASYPSIHHPYDAIFQIQRIIKITCKVMHEEKKRTYNPIEYISMKY
jgi:hypothetical protein